MSDQNERPKLPASDHEDDGKSEEIAVNSNPTNSNQDLQEHNLDKKIIDLNLLIQSIPFALLCCLGIRIILPAFLDSFLSTILLGTIPPLLVSLVLRGLVKKFSAAERWASLVTATLIGAITALIFSSPPFTLMAVIVGAGLLSHLLERTKGPRPYLTVILVLVVFLPSLVRKKIDGPGLLVLGIDAMDYTVTNDLLENDQLPHIRKLIENGVSGPFESEEPSFSPILWTTIASGRGREIHGIDGFYNTSEHVQVPRIWDILQDEGWSIGIYRWLVTWPPNENVNGFSIPDILSRDNQAIPPEYGIVNDFRDLIKGQMLHGERKVPLREIAGYAWAIIRLGVRGSTLLSIGKTAMTHPIALFNDASYRYILMRRTEMEVNCDLFLQLLRRYQPEFAVFYDNSIDMVGHRYWKNRDLNQEPVSNKRSKDYSSAVPLIYKWTDDVVGRVINEISPSCHIAIISDHGQKGMNGDDEDSWVILGDNVLQVLDLDDTIYVATLGSTSYLFPVKRGQFDSLSLAVSRELERLRIVEGDLPLLTVRTDPKSKVPFLDLTRNDLTGKEEITLDAEIVPFSQFITRYFTQTGTHDRYGVIILSGPGLRRGTTLTNSKLRDLIPTILHWEGLSVARDMEGEVILQAFDSIREIRYIESYMKDPMEIRVDEIDVDPEVKQKLRALGYVN